MSVAGSGAAGASGRPAHDVASVAPIRWPAEAIWEAVAPALPGFTVEVVPQLDSTNSELMRRARAGQLAPVLLVAEQQTAGRGRLGRQWFSGGRAGALTFSLGLPLAPLDWSGLSLAVGLSVVQSLHPELRLKWPNDVWWHDRKLAGILIETVSGGDRPASRYAVIGVGVNILPPREAAGLATSPAWLGEVLPGIDAPQALLRMAGALVQTLKLFEQHGFSLFQHQFNDRDALAGLAVILSDGTAGLAQGVDSSGALLVHTAQGLKKVTSAEVSVRPLNPPAYEHL